MSPESDGVLAQVRGVTVRYGATTALDAVSVDFHAGEVHALVGENGAGKSTLLRVMAAATRPNVGAVRLISGLRFAWVPQDTQLPPDLTIAEWIFLGRELRGPLGWLREREMHAQARAVLEAIGCAAAPRARVGTLPLTQRKQVQLARAVHTHPDLLLLDEPTAVLGASETQRLFDWIRMLRQHGAAVVYVSHRLHEVLEIADRVTVLRDGQHVSTDPVRAVNVGILVHRMVGRDVAVGARGERQRGEEVLRLDGVSVAHVRDASLTVHRGEVVGLAGLVGAGRSELLEGIMRLRRTRSGAVRSTAVPVFVPEDRGSKGLVSALGLCANIFLPADGFLIDSRREHAQAGEWIRTLNIRTSSVEAPIDSLSGGNQQKVLLARALRHRPSLLLLDEPTAGVDVGAKAEIHELICELAERGTAVLLASSDLPELLLLCDRIIALREGRVVGESDAAEASEPRLASLITGAVG